MNRTCTRFFLAMFVGFLLHQGAPAQEGQETIRVPNLVGLNLEDARGILARAGFHMVAQEKYTDDEPGLVLEQSPAAGSTGEGLSTVRLVVAAREMVGVPDVVAGTIADTRDTLTSVGLQVVEEERADDSAPGTVLEQQPPAGTTVEVGTTVHVIVSSGRPAVVPSLVGGTLVDAIRRLQESGLRAVVEETASDLDSGTVIDQLPAPGMTVDAGTPVRLLVPARGAEVVVPDLSAGTVAEAMEQLTQAGLQAVVEQRPDNAEPGSILGQHPGAGARVKAGASVRLVVAAARKMVVPNLVVGRIDDAERVLAAAGLRMAIEERPSDEAPGTVLGQHPPAGAMIDADTPVRLIVAKDGTISASLLVWIVTGLLVLMVGGYLLVRARSRTREKAASAIQTRPVRDPGVQGIAVQGALSMNIELRLRPTSDFGEQTVDGNGSLVIEERRENG